LQEGKEKMSAQKYPLNRIKVPKFSEENGFYTTKERSNLMCKIRAKETKPEQILRKTLWALGVRYRKNVNKLQGKPDIVISKFKLIVFVDGAFWHGYNWEEKKNKIKSNREFWIPKVERNMQRDAEINSALEGMGWIVIRFWDFQVKKELGVCIQKILEHIEYYEEYS